MSTSLDLLLAADPAQVKDVPTGKIEIKRLTRRLGEPFFVSFKAAPLKMLEDITKKALGVDKTKSDIDEARWTLYELVTDPNFKDQKIQDKYGAARPLDVVEAILMSGEVMTVYREILKLSGFDKSGAVDIDEVKN